MILFVTVLHILLCIILILVILLQPGKGGDVAAAFGAGGGGGSSAFGPRGPANLLSRATTVVAVLFMVTSITLAISTQKGIGGNSGDLEDGALIEEEEGFDMPAFAPKDPAPTPVELPEAVPFEPPAELGDPVEEGGAGAP